MPDVPIRASRDKGVILPRNHRVRQILSERLERPDKQDARESDQDASAPPKPERDRHGRPLHELWIDHPDDAANEPWQAAQTQAKQDERTFLPSIQLLSRQVGTNSVVESKRQKADEHRHEDPSEEFVVGQHNDPVLASVLGL